MTPPKPPGKIMSYSAARKFSDILVSIFVVCSRVCGGKTYVMLFMNTLFSKIHFNFFMCVFVSV